MKKGFTLAEVLITLGVIGVVAALTLPNLLQNHQKKVFVAQLQRVTNLISNSATALQGDNNAALLSDSYLVAVASKGDDGKTTWDYKNAQGKFMNTYFKVARDCGTDNRKACLGDIYYSQDRSKSFDIDEQLSTSYYCVTINTGATICMDSMRPDYNGSWTDSDGKLHTYLDHGYSNFVIDVNGPSGPNTNGRDLFQFELYTDGRLGNGWQPTQSATSTDCTDDYWKPQNVYGAGHCFQRIMSNGWVMDY